MKTVLAPKWHHQFIFFNQSCHRSRAFEMRALGPGSEDCCAPSSVLISLMWEQGDGGVELNAKGRLVWAWMSPTRAGFGCEKDTLGAGSRSHGARTLDGAKTRSFLLLGGLFMFLHPVWRCWWDGGPWGESCFPGESPGAVWHSTPSTNRRKRRRVMQDASGWTGKGGWDKGRWKSKIK